MRKKQSIKTIEAYEKYGEQYIENIKGLTPPEFFEFVKILPKCGKVLDVGCAGGRDSKKFVQKGFKTVGIDLVDAFLRTARKNVPKAKFIKMDMRKLKFPAQYFDGLWASAVLLHLERKNVPKVLREFNKVLKAGGKLFVGVKVGKGIGYKKDKLLTSEKRKFTYFSKSEIDDLVKKAGFKILVSHIAPDDAGRRNIKWIRLWAER